ncbi:MAG: ROK family protein [Bacteroidales bacterium]|jgi:glucokinase|nr:ROK family protein [Bacteroidales bacterium]
MALLGIDIGGTKIAFAVIDKDGNLPLRDIAPIDKRSGTDVGEMIITRAEKLITEAENSGHRVKAIGLSVPGISRQATGTVWAPNIPGWDDYPLLKEVKTIAGNTPVTIESDRACYISAEVWKGNARGCRNAVFIAVGTGIGAGIMVNGEILHGAHDIAGATGWMALSRTFDCKYRNCGCFEYYASGEGIARRAEELIHSEKEYDGMLRDSNNGRLTAEDVFKAWNSGDQIAGIIVNQAIEYWGMAAANIVSLLNPEKIIFGGGVFGPAVGLIPQILAEAEKWAQPISIKQVTFEPTALAGDAGVLGAAYLAMKKISGIKR